MYFINVLKNKGINPDDYLIIVNYRAKKLGYNEMFFSDDNKHKIMTLNDKGLLVKFGSAINNDYIIYRLLENMGEVKKGTANIKRKSYLSRATNIKGNWKKNKYSKNNLAINILW